jgi:hypothetical protein
MMDFEAGRIAKLIDGSLCESRHEVDFEGQVLRGFELDGSGSD